MGLILAWGPCFYYCTPIILSYLAGTKSGWGRGAVNVIVFSASRMIAYIVVISIAFLIGNSVIRNWYEQGYGRILYYGAGIITIILGLLLLVGKDIMHFRWCSRLLKNMPKNNLVAMIMLGFIIGITPCIPLFGVINYVVFEAQSLPQAILYALCFGIGTVLGPLIPLGIFASGLTKIAAKISKFLKLNIKPNFSKLNLFTRLCGLVLIYFGIKLICYL